MAFYKLKLYEDFSYKNINISILGSFVSKALASNIFYQLNSKITSQISNEIIKIASIANIAIFTLL
jgi:hypothetical protein